MQRTRLNVLLDSVVGAIDSFFTNPWRRISLLIISLLFGFFSGSALITTSGQAAGWDITGAALLFIFTESVSGINYRFYNLANTLWFSCLNLFKMGLIYSLFLEAFKLGS